MGWTIAAIVGGVVLLWVLKNTFSPYGRFWRLVARNPDLSLTLFMTEPDCLVDMQPVMKRDYVGPFHIYSSRGTTHVIYIPHALIDEIQVRIGGKIRSVNS